MAPDTPAPFAPARAPDPVVRNWAVAIEPERAVGFSLALGQTESCCPAVTQP
jgi:hypothetical protein